MEDGAFFNDGKNNHYLGSYEDGKVFLTVDKADSVEKFLTDGVWIIDQYTDLAQPYWSASRQGFYVPSVSKYIPGDAVKVEKSLYKELLQKQADGAELTTGTNGQPTSVEKTVANLTGLKHDLLEASADTLGHMRVGVGLTVDAGGVVNIAPASANGIGGVQIGDGLAVDNMGKLTLSGDSALPGYTAEDKEKVLTVKADGSGLDWATPENILSSSPVQYVNGVGHYKDSTGWHTIEPAGKICATLGNFSSLPPGTLPCKGDIVKIADYPELYAALWQKVHPAASKIPEGENNQDYFVLPDLRKRFLRGYGYDAVTGSAENWPGTTGGQATQTLTTSQIPLHWHSVPLSNLQHTHGSGTMSTLAAGSHSHSVTGYKTSKGATDDAITVLQYPKGGVSTTSVSTTSSGSHSHSMTGTTSTATWKQSADPSVTGTGGGGSFSVEPPYIVVNYYIHTGKVLIN